MIQRPSQPHPGTDFANGSDSVTEPQLENILGRRQRPCETLTDRSNVRMGIQRTVLTDTQIRIAA